VRESEKEIAKMSFFLNPWIHVTQKELESSVKTLWRNQKELQKSLIHGWIHTAAQSCAKRHGQMIENSPHPTFFIDQI